MRLKSDSVVGLVLVVAMVILELGAGAGQSTVEECKGTITAMMGCLPYATGKAENPTADCCRVMNTTVQHNKDCLCKFIALVHNGSPEVSSLGVQEAKLTQLPSACGLKNVSASNCPSSPPSASNLNTTTTTTTRSAGAGYKLHLPLPVQAFVLLAMMAFLFPFPDGLRFSN